MCTRGLLAFVALGTILDTGAFAGPTRDDLRNVSLAAVGDVLLARGIGAAMARHGVDYPFAKVSKLLAPADLVVFNLECTLSRRGVPQHERYQFRADPTLATTLSKHGLDVAILANNHTLDYGRDPLLDTIEAVERAGMVAVGAGKNRDEATRLRVVKKNSLRIGFLAFTDTPNTGVVRRDDLPTVAGVDDDSIANDIRAAQSTCDTLVVYFHWGIEYMKKPTARQQLLARKSIEAGADLVLGCHPHVLQTVETYLGKPIVYSLGGFVFDSRVFGSDRSAIFWFTLGPRSARLVKTVPIEMRNGQTRPLVPTAHRALGKRKSG